MSVTTYNYLSFIGTKIKHDHATAMQQSLYVSFCRDHATHKKPSYLSILHSQPKTALGDPNWTDTLSCLVVSQSISDNHTTSCFYDLQQNSAVMLQYLKITCVPQQLTRRLPTQCKVSCPSLQHSIPLLDVQKGIRDDKKPRTLWRPRKHKFPTQMPKSQTSYETITVSALYKRLQTFKLWRIWDLCRYHPN